MEFRKYNSIENSYREAFLEVLRENGFDQYEYVVQEKVHGANLSFQSDGQEIRTAKRSGYIQEGEAFYTYEVVRDRLEMQLHAVFVAVKAQFPETEFVAVYGELFGGNYKHPEVERVKNVSNIQKGIQYNPDIGFYAFDILVNNQTYLDVDLANAIFEQVGLFYARTLFRGSLEAALAYPNEFDSKIGEWLGLPVLTDNVCEGVVIRPVTPLFLGNGSRVLIKNKNERWEEKVRAKRSKRPPVELSGDAVALQEALKDYLTANRLENVISKIGEVSLKDFGQVMGMFMPDALEDFEKDYGEAWNTLEKETRKRVTKGLTKYAADLVRTALKR